LGAVGFHSRVFQRAFQEERRLKIKVGRLEIEIWKDTGTPRFRIWWWRSKIRYNKAYWIFKIISYYTLWIRWDGYDKEQGNLK